MPEYENYFKPPLEKAEVVFATDMYLQKNGGFEMNDGMLTYRNVESVLKIVRDTREAPA